METLEKYLETFAKAISNSTKCRGANQGGLHKIALALEVISTDTKKATAALEKVINILGQIQGNLNPTVNAIIKLADDLNTLAEEIRKVAANKDFFSGDFAGVEEGLQDFSHSLDDLTAQVERITLVSKALLVSDVDESNLDKGLKGVRTALLTVRKAVFAELKRCGGKPKVVGFITKGLALAAKEVGQFKKSLN